MNSKGEYLNFNPGESLDMAALRKACEGILKVRDFVPLHPKAVLHLLDMLEAAKLEAAHQNEEIAKLTTAYTELSKMFHDQVVAQQSAWIEWQHGEGAETAMGWIENGLCGPGHIPDEDDPYGKEAQAWYDANNSDPFPACQCGRPSNMMWMGMGFCSQAHHDAAMAATKGEEA